MALVRPVPGTLQNGCFFTMRTHGTMPARVTGKSFQETF